MTNTFFDDVISRKKTKVTIGALIILIFLFLSYGFSLFAFISPSREQRWETSIVSLDKSSYIRGETVTASILLEEGSQFINEGGYFDFVSTEDIIWTITVFDPDDTPIYVESLPILNAQGDITQDNIIFQIPLDTAVGEYKIRIIVWTEELPDGVSRTNLIHESSFEVTS